MNDFFLWLACVVAFVAMMMLGLQACDKEYGAKLERTRQHISKMDNDVRKAIGEQK